MLRLSCGLLTALVTLSLVQSAQANWFHHIWHVTKRDYHRNNCWPEPFVEPDEASVRAPFETMAANGWRRQNLLGRHHFREDGVTLTESGKIKIRNILTQVPPKYRTIFVERSWDPADTAKRIDGIQQLATRFVPTGELPAVQDTHLFAEGRSAAVVDQTFTAFQETAPPPQLPAYDPASLDSGM